MSVIVRLDKCQAVSAGNITSVQSATPFDNGSFVNLGALITGQKDVYTLAVPATGTLATEEVLLVYSPEVNYEPAKTLKDFTNLANIPARAYHLTVGDVITITDDGIDGTSVLEQYLVPQNASTKLVASASIGSTRLSGKVIEKGTFGYSGTGYGRNASTTIRIVKV